jgi:hypothetical protein
MKRPLVLAIAGGAALLSGCMSQADTGAVEAAIAQFHEDQAMGDDQAIYDAATAAFRAAARLEDLARLNAAVRAVEGCTAPTRDAAQWRNNVTTSGHFITVVYNRQCTGGPLAETFVYQIVGGEAALLNYNVSGMALFPAMAPAAPATEPTAPTTAPPETPPATPAPEPASASESAPT